jgi:hypothetical protein
MSKEATVREDITQLSTPELCQKIRETQELICNNFNLCSSILDLKIRELQLMIEVRDSRKEVDDGK